MTNRLDRDFHLPGLLRFALPTIIMMLVVSLYTIVDGVLIARLVGENALAAANVAIPPSASPWPWGSCWAPALRRGGPQDGGWISGGGPEGLRLSGPGGGVHRPGGLPGGGPVRRAAGPAAGGQRSAAGRYVTYLRVQLCFAPMAMLQLLFESFFVTAGRPGLGLGLATAAGVTNAVLDYLYMGPMQMGILGAAWALLRATRFPPWRGCSFSCSAGRGSALAAPTGICACWAGPASTARPRW